MDEAYASTHKKTNGKGPDVLFRELKAKGIDDDTIKETLSAFTFDEQIQEALKHIGKILKKDKKLSTKEIRQRAQMQLQRKGFPFDVINAASISASSSFSYSVCSRAALMTSKGKPFR